MLPESQPGDTLSSRAQILTDLLFNDDDEIQAGTPQAGSGTDKNHENLEADAQEAENGNVLNQNVHNPHPAIPDHLAHHFEEGYFDGRQPLLQNPDDDLSKYRDLEEDPITEFETGTEAEEQVAEEEVAVEDKAAGSIMDELGSMGSSFSDSLWEELERLRPKGSQAALPDSPEEKIQEEIPKEEIHVPPAQGTPGEETPKNEIHVPPAQETPKEETPQEEIHSPTKETPKEIHSPKEKIHVPPAQETPEAETPKDETQVRPAQWTPKKMSPRETWNDDIHGLTQEAPEEETPTQETQETPQAGTGTVGYKGVRVMMNHFDEDGRCVAWGGWYHSDTGRPCRRRKRRKNAEGWYVVVESADSESDDGDLWGW
jgi:hypothetical protein